MNLIDLTGERVGRLTVLGRSGYRGAVVAWDCRCDCGKIVTKGGDLLRKHLTRSCGCLRRDASRARRYKHGSPPEYRIWSNIKERCYRKSNKFYSNYGGRGIKMCERWRSDFRNFYADMGPRPSSEHSIDRIDGDGDYEPGNCRWTTKEIQAFNRRTTVPVIHNGKAMALSAYAREMGVCDNKLWYWHRSQGWPLDKAVAHIRSGKGRKLTPEIVREIIASNDTQTALAERYGVSQALVCRILNGRTWKHIPR